MSNLNAIDGLWVPVVDSQGNNKLLSLAEVFNPNDSSVALSVPAWEELAFINLLVSIATAACKPSTDSEILSYLDNKPLLCTKVLEYLTEWHDHFWLHHPKFPLFQVLCLETKYPNPGEKGAKGFTYRATADLAWEGEKSALLRSPRVHQGTASSEGLLRTLLVSQVCGGNLKYGFSKPGGPHLKPQGQVQDFQTGISYLLSTNGGSTSTQNFRVDGDSLLESIILNMVPESTIQQIWPVHGIGKPSWEYEWNDHTDIVARADEHTNSFLGRLVPIRKFIWVDPMNPARMIYAAAEGLDYQNPLQALKAANQYDSSYYIAPRGLQDPKVKAALGTLQDEIPLWKEFASLKGAKELPGVLTKLLGYGGSVRISSTSMQVSSGMGLVYFERCRVSTVEWPSGTFSKYITGLPTLNTMVADANNMGTKLWGAVSTYNKVMGMDPKGKIAEQNLVQVKTAFWKSLGGAYPEYLKMLSNPNIINEWSTLCKESANKAIHSSLKGLGSRRNKAVTLAVNQIK